MRGRHINLAEVFSDASRRGKRRFGRCVEWNFDAGREP
jgi:hypothetical protein